MSVDWDAVNGSLFAQISPENIVIALGEVAPEILPYRNVFVIQCMFHFKLPFRSGSTKTAPDDVHFYYICVYLVCQVKIEE